MWIAIQWTQVTAGVGFALLTEPWRVSYSCSRHRPLLYSLRDFLADFECTLKIADTYTVCIHRVHDRILMKDALIEDYTVSEIQAINRCRLYLKVECLSDLCTADGLKIDPGFQAQSPTVKMPYQGLPSPHSKTVWRRFLIPYTRFHEQSVKPNTRPVPTLIRCSLPPIPPEPVLETIRSLICATLANYT
jgi:hypothetical protein